MLSRLKEIKQKKLFFSVLSSTLFFSFIVKFFPFKILIKILRHQIKLPFLKFKLDEVLNYERKISNKMKINQCLVRMSALFCILKQSSYKPKLFIGVGSGNKFKSHAWIRVKNTIIDLDKREDYQIIMEII